MQRLEDHDRVTQVIGIRNILDIRILRPVYRVFAYGGRLQKLEIDEQDRRDEDFAGKADVLIAAHKRRLNPKRTKGCVGGINIQINANKRMNTEVEVSAQ